ncbi:hypothetical protein P9759_08585, partial [Heyndrickxia coagulans]|nr:hypothetical protein [Heyndrickxia coagulans]
FLSTPYFFIIFACFPLFLGGKFFYPFFKPLGYKESVTSQLPHKDNYGNNKNADNVHGPFKVLAFN